MPKVGFNPHALSVPFDHQRAYMRGPLRASALEPFVSEKVGIDAIREGLRFADVEGFPLGCVDSPAKNIDPR